jgi:hypothetical protein
MTQSEVETPWDEFSSTATAEQSGEVNEDEDIFGDIDMNDVSDNPFDVKDGTYLCRCISAQISSKDGNRYLKMEWSIEDSTSEFDGMKLRDQQQLPPRGAKWNELTPAQQKSLKFFKMKLRQTFDLSETQISTFKPSDLIDKEAMLTTTHNQGKGENANRSYVNVDKAISVREYNERQAKYGSSASEAAKSVGL